MVAVAAPVLLASLTDAFAQPPSLDKSQGRLRYASGGALLWDALSPQLRSVLLAEVALGVMVPG